MSLNSVPPGPEGGLVLRGPDMPELLRPEIQYLLQARDGRAMEPPYGHVGMSPH